MDNIDLGETIPVVTRWWDDAGIAVEPSTVNVTVTKPNGTVLTFTKATLTPSSSLTPASTLDTWSVDIVGDVAGLWRINAAATIDSDAAIPQDFMVLVGIEEATGWCGQWATWDDVARCGTPPDLDLVGRDIILDSATEILYLLSDRKYPGICTVTRSLCFACASCFPAVCSCDPYPAVDLGGRYPVWGAWDVRLDGELLASSAYEIRGRRWLVRTDGEAWPIGSGWVATEPDAFTVTWAYGRQPPLSGRLAAARYAAEGAKLCAGLPCGINAQSATNTVREGVTYTVLDVDGVIADGRTGLGTVDAWLVADAKGSRALPHMYHPSLGASRRIV